MDSTPRVLTLLIERNPYADQDPNHALVARVYQAPGQDEPPPRFVVRPGERLRMRVANKDAHVHSFIFPYASMDLNAWPRKASTTEEFRAPTKPGAYTFFCRFGREREKYERQAGRGRASHGEWHVRVFLSVSYSSEVDAAGVVRAAYRRQLEEVISFFEQAGHQVFCAPREDGWKLNDVSPGQAFLLDLVHIVACDVLVAFVGSRVSAGTQTELGYAVRDKQIVLVTPASEPLSYINQGMVDSGRAQLVEYASREDLLAKLQHSLASLTG